MNQLKELLNATFEHLYKDDNKIESEDKMNHYIIQEYKQRILDNTVFKEMTINNTQIAKNKIKKIRKYTTIAFIACLFISVAFFYIFSHDVNTGNNRDVALLTTLFAPFLLFLISIPIISRELHKQSDIVYHSIEEKYKPVLTEVTETLLNEIDLQSNDFLKLVKEKEYLRSLLTKGERDFQSGKKNKLFKRIKKEVSEELFNKGK